MKIDEMLQREDFYNILEKTLEKYYHDKYNKEYSIEVTASTHKEKVLVFEKLNRIITKKPCKRIRQSIYESFNINDNMLKWIAAKIYIFFALSAKSYFADKGLHLSDPLLIADYQVIVPGNKKIRINDYKSQTSELIVKDGFFDDYFKREVCFRTENPYDFVVPIIEQGEYWYKEKLIDGRCLARITDKAVYKKATEDVVKYLKLLYEKHGNTLSGKEYSDRLKNSILKNLEKVSTVKTDVKFNYEKSVQTVEILADRAALLKVVPLTCSHGDMQSGNIMVDKSGKTLIIDWETYGERSIWYDVVTLFLFTRRFNRWKGIIENRFSPDEQEVIFTLDSSRDYNIDSVIAVLLLEDLDFKLTDALMIPGKLGCDSLNPFINEISEDGLL